MVRNKDSYNKFKADKLTFNQTRNYSTVTFKHWSKGLISPISLVNKVGKIKLLNPAPIFTMDIETIK